MVANRKADSQNIIAKMLLFIVAPFPTFLYSLKDMGTKSSFWVLILFNLLFGLNFSVTNDRSAEFNLDGSFYRQQFDNYCNGWDLRDKAIEYVQFDEETNKDLYSDAVAYVVSRVTSNYHILFFVYALIFTYFMSKSLKYLLQYSSFRNGSIICFFLFLLFVLNDIFNINGVRFWTASWVAIYCIFKIFVDNKRTYLALLCLTPLIHASYIVFVIVAFLGYFFNKSAPALRRLLLLSIVLSPLLVIAVQYIDASNLPAFVQRYIDVYASESAMGVFNEQKSSTLYFMIRTAFSVISLIYTNILILKITKASEKRQTERKMTNFLIFLAIFCNLIQILPSGGRFYYLCYPIIAYLWLTVKGIHEDAVWIKVFPILFFMTLWSKLHLYTLVLDSDFYYMNLISLIYKNI